MTPRSLFQTGRHSREWITDFYDQASSWWGPDPQEPGVHKERRAAVERLCGTGPLRVLELGSGSGHTAAALADAAHEVVAVELSPVRARHAAGLACLARPGRLTALKDDFYTAAIEGPFDAVCCWETFGLGSDADQRRLLMRIAREWPAPRGRALLDVYSPYRPAREAGTEVRLDPLEGVPGSVEMIERCHFDPMHSRWIDEWVPVARPDAARAQSIRCYTPADLLLLLEGTGLGVQHIEVAGDGQIFVPGGEQITLSPPLLEAWSYLAVLEAAQPVARQAPTRRSCAPGASVAFGPRRQERSVLIESEGFSLGALASTVSARLKTWQEEGSVPRLWAKDHTLWTAEPKPEIADRLGWLTLPETMRAEVPALQEFAAGVAADGITRVVLLGMGGSSLAPEVFARTFGSRPGHPRLMVLDSTHPGSVCAVDAQTDPATTLFLVSSKSGTTIEPLSFFRHSWARVSAATPHPGRHFAAITDPGTPLAGLAADHGFRRVFRAAPDVGGRFSALSHFGLVPAALIGADLSGLLDRAEQMAAECRRPPAENPGFALGAALGDLARTGRDKATFLVSPSIAGFPAWVEQLLAESTGKDGTGIVPVADEALGSPEAYGADRCFVYLSCSGDADAAQAAAVDALEAAGQPVIRICLNQPTDLAAEMFRAEVAAAMAGSVLGIHPFDQPDVQMAKELASRAMAGEESGDPIAVVEAGDRSALSAALAGLLARGRPGDYFGIQAFIEPTREALDSLQRLRHRVRDRFRLATTLGFGPRFLHSTGQLHKGGPDSGLFLQVVDDPRPNLPVPSTGYTFGRLVAAQADGDFRALASRGRRVQRVSLGRDPVAGLAALAAAGPS